MTSFGWNDADILGHDQRNLARSALLSLRRASANYAAPVWGYSICDSAGQSEEMGWQSAPALTVNTPASLGALMLGDSIYGLNQFDTSFTVAGSVQLNPIVGATVAYASTIATWAGTQLMTYSPASVAVVLNSDGSITVTTSDASIDFTKGVWSASSGQSGSCGGLQVGYFVQMAGFTGAASGNNTSANTDGVVNAYKISSVSKSSLTLTQATSSDTNITDPLPALTAVSGAAGVTIEVLVGGILWYMGEGQCVQASVAFRKYQLAAYGIESDNSRQLVTFASAVGGQSITALSKGATPAYYNRGPSALSQILSLAATAKVTCGVYLIEWLQGGSDGGTAYADYLAALKAYHDTKAADYMAATGQAHPPRMELAVLSQQNGTTYDHMGVHRAQVDYVLANPDKAYCVGAIYPAPDFAIHVCNYGEVWMGAMRAKFRNAVFNRGQLPIFVCMTAATARGNVLVVDFMAPCAPLRFVPVFVGCECTTLPSQGFVLVDAGGNQQDIVSVSLAGDLTVRIVTATAVQPGAWLYYAPNDFGCMGSGNLFDSDPTVSNFAPQSTPGDGTPIAYRNLYKPGRPMSLANPAVPYALPVTFG